MFNILRQKKKRMKKNDYSSKKLVISIGLIACLMPIINHYNLYSKIGQIAMGIAMILTSIIENKFIKRIIALIAIIIILYSYFKLGI